MIFFFIGLHKSSQKDNFQCSQWWDFHQNDISISVYEEMRCKKKPNGGK